MKKIVLLLSFFSLVSCGSLRNFFKPTDSTQAPSSGQEESEADSVRLYFQESEELLNIPTVNQSNKTLKLFDQFVFSTEDYFKANKNQKPELTLKSEQKDSAESPFKFNVFCNSSKEELQKESSNLRQNYQKELAAVPSHLSVVSLIPEAFLAQNLDNPFYCSFIFQVRSKNYILIQQQLDPVSSSSSLGQQNLFALALLNTSNSGTQELNPNRVLTQKELPSLSLADSTGQKSENYELYCQGEKISSISSEVSDNVIVSKMLELENWPTGIQTCRLFSKNKNQIVGISHSFQLDFDNLSSQKKAFPEVLPTTIAVYFQESDQFVNLDTVDKETKALKLFDRFVFSDEEYFRANRLQDKDLSPSAQTESSQTPFQSTVLCQFSKEELKKETDLRETYQLNLDYIPSDLQIASILPKSFLSQFDQAFDCSFTFQVRSQKYTLLQKSLVPSSGSSDKQSLFALDLLEHTDSGKKNLDKTSLLTSKNIPLLSLADSTGQNPSHYELYCDGQLRSSVDSSVSPAVIFSKLLDLEVWPKGTQTCRLLSKNKNQVLGISSLFQIDFEDLSYQSPLINLQNFKVPKFILRKGLAGVVKFSDLEDSAPPQSIDIKSQAQCFYMDQESNLEYSILTKTSIQPLQKEIPIMSIIPLEALLKLSINYDEGLYSDQLLDFEYSLKEKKIGTNKVEKKFTLDWWVREYHILRLESELSEDWEAKANSIENSRLELVCIYKIQLEDQNNPSNFIEFEPIIKTIRWKKDKSRKGYGVGLLALNGVTEVPVFTNKELKALQEEALNNLSYPGKDIGLFKSAMYKDIISIDDITNKIYSLPLNDFDQDNSSSQTDIRRISLMCYKEDIEGKPFTGSFQGGNFQFKQKSWPADNSVSRNSINLSDLLSDEEIQDFIEDGELKALVVCRVLFYSQYKGKDYLKYFSPEVRFTN